MSTSLMRAIRIHEHGGPEVLRTEELPLPSPGPGEVLVRLDAMALNHLDLWIRRGIPGVTFALPLTPGADGAGRIESLGPGVAGPGPGSRVVVLPGLSCGDCPQCLAGRDNLCPEFGIVGEDRDGTAAEAVLLPAVNVAPAPGNLSSTDAASFALTFLTAWHMLIHKARVAPGERLLVHAAASGVGAAGIQIALQLGARVAATASTPEKLDLARRLGAETAFSYRDEDWRQKVRAWAGAPGVDVVFDSVGQATFAPSLRLLAKGGRYVFCGATSGFELTSDFRPLFFKNQEILGSTMGRRADLFRIIDLFAAGRFRPVVDEIFPFEKMADAHRRLEERRAIGKIVVQIR